MNAVNFPGMCGLHGPAALTEAGQTVRSGMRASAILPVVHIVMRSQTFSRRSVDALNKTGLLAYGRSKEISTATSCQPNVKKAPRKVVSMATVDQSPLLERGASYSNAIPLPVGEVHLWWLEANEVQFWTLSLSNTQMPHSAFLSASFAWALILTSIAPDQIRRHCS